MKEQKHIKMPSIEQFRHIVYNINRQSAFVEMKDNEPVFDYLRPKPTLSAHGAVKLHGCVEKNTMVTLANGELIPIYKVTEGTYILTYNEKTKKQELKPVLNAIVQKLDKKWVKLVFDSTTLICTEDHKVFTENRGYIEAKNLKISDKFVEVLY